MAETSLHRDLKRLYGGSDARLEVRLEGFRIDAVAGDELIEIQHGSLAAIRDKVRRLLENHRVLIVKPIVIRKLLVSENGAGRVTSRRASPKRETLLTLFDELVYFARVFPHEGLTIEALPVEIEEWRRPGHGRRRRWRKNDQVVVDQKLISVGEAQRFQTAGDLLRMLPGTLPRSFHSGQLAEALGVRRHIAQRVAYCLRETGAVSELGKQGNSRLYGLPARRRARAA